MISEILNKESTDKEIWKRFKLGDVDAFNLMFEKYMHVLLEYGRRFSSDFQLLEDCAQETYIEIWLKKDRLSTTDSIKYYLFKSFKRKIFRRIKKESNALIYDEVMENTSMLQDVSHEGSLIEYETESRTNRLLKDAVNNLSNRQKEAINLRFYKELSFKEVSGVMGIGIKSTYRVISSAIERLQCTVMADQVEY